ncbi:hypothetical protein GCM10010532_097950 [Dactylosporangium siamense]|uniref:Uncharacterized protein n=1 Tax=Dactylosporangium siamense TaxID=685454 RepID=A0A919Q3F4_9ACTN|nr:hypothetical protein Dsi01nite_112060 [Dactylosporangium siamense]
MLVAYGDWSGADVTLHVEQAAWEGLGDGRGRVQCRKVSVVARGRGAAARPRRTTMWLPAPSGLYAHLRAPQLRPDAERQRHLASVPTPQSPDWAVTDPFDRDQTDIETRPAVAT